MLAFSFSQSVLVKVGTLIVLGATVLSFFTFTTAPALAQANPQMNYQGKLTTLGGVAVTDGTYNMRFWLLTSSTIATSSALWTESLTGVNRVQVTNGLFSIMLGSTTPLSGVDFNQTLYLGVEIGGTSTPAWDGEMSPRKILGTVPAAFVAGYAATAGTASSSANAALLGGVASTSFLRSDEADTMAATSSATLISFIQNGAGAIARFFSGVTEVFTILNNGNVGVGTSTPSERFTVDGTVRVTGTSTLATSSIASLNLVTALTAVNGGTGFSTITQNQLLIGGAGNTWSQVATSALGLGNNTFLGLTDTPASYNANRLLFTNSGATAVTDSDALVFTGTNFGIGSTTPSARLTIQGASSTANTLTIASSTGATTLAMRASGDLELPGQLVSQGITWTSRTTPDNDWRSVTYGNGLFVAVAESGTSSRVMTSPDGINWTVRIAAAENSWRAVTYGNGLFVAVAGSCVGNCVMTSPDGINWTIRTSASDIYWQSVTYGNGLFVAVASYASTDNVMTSPDGINWTLRTSASASDWFSVTYGNGRFVAVAFSGSGDRVMTSPDGINWASSTPANNSAWTSVTYGNGLFVAVAAYAADGVMTSPDGVTWTARNTPPYDWRSVTYGNGLFVAVAFSGTSTRVMTSPDGINWTSRTSAADNDWVSVTYGNGLFVAVSDIGASNRVMTSGKTFTNALAANNIYQGGTSFLGGLRAGTTSTSVAASIFLQSQAGINPFAIASSSGATLLTLTQAGNLGLGTTTPNSLLTVAGSADITGNLNLSNATSSAAGVITRDGTRFLYDFIPINGGGYAANLFLGRNAGNFTMGSSTGPADSAVENIGIGDSALSANTIGSYNTAVGVGSLQNNTTGLFNTALGRYALSSNTTGSDNLAIGVQALSSNVSGSSNVAIGIGALQNATSSGRNTVVGNGAGNTITTGYTNTLLGFETGLGITTGWYNTILGAGVTGLAADLSNNIIIADGQGNQRINVGSTGNVGIGTTTPSAKLDVWGNVQIGTSTRPLFFANTAARQVSIGTSSVINSFTSPEPALMALSGNFSTEGKSTHFVINEEGVDQYSAGEIQFLRSYNIGDYRMGVILFQNAGSIEAWTDVGDSVAGSLRFVTDAPGAGTSSVERMRLTSEGNLGIGTTTPSSRLTVDGDIYATGAFRDSSNNAGTLGMILQTTGTSTSWVATSTLGLGGGGATTFLALTDTPASYISNQILFTNAGASALIGSDNFTFDGSRLSVNGDIRSGFFVATSTTGTSTFAGRVGIGTTTPGSLLTVAGSADITGNLNLSNATSSAAGVITRDGTRFLYDFKPSNVGGDDFNLFLGRGAGNFTMGSSTGPADLGAGNIGIGDNVLRFNTTGGYNTGVGASSLANNTNGYANTAIGRYALFSNTGGGFNVAIGGNALASNVSGTSNVAIGLSALLNATSTYFNTGIGQNAGNTITTGWGNTILGSGTGLGITTGEYNTILGANVTGLSSTLSNNIIIADGQGNQRINVGSTGNVGIGSTTPSARLTIQGAAGAANTFMIASSTGSTTLAMRASGDLELPGQLVSQGITWTTRTSVANNNWQSVTYGNGLFVAVADTDANSIMTSPDGINWTTRTGSSDIFFSVTYGNGLFVAVSRDPGDPSPVATSPDGITWTERTAPQATWQSVTYGNGLFVAVSRNGVSNNVMTSPDGINWTSRPGTDSRWWSSVTYGNGLFVSLGNGDHLMTSPDGITWSTSTVPSNIWWSVTYGNGLFVAVGEGGTSNVLTSPDGITWTVRTTPTTNNWRSVTYGNGLFVAVAFSGTGTRVMTSPDGINWTLRTSAADNDWKSVTYGNGLFVAVAETGTSTRVMTSGKTFTNALAANNIYQGGTSFLGGLRAGTTSTSVAASIFLQSQAGINPFAIASSSGATLLTLTQAGNLGLGTTTPGSLLTVAGSAAITGTTTFGSALSLAGGFFDSTNNAGTNGMILQTTGTSTRWVATSTLGLGGGGATTFLALTDTPASYIANQILFTNPGASALIGSDNFTFDGSRLSVNGDIRSGFFVATSTTGTSTFAGRVGIGTITPSARLTIQGDAGAANTFMIASSTGSTTLAMRASGDLELPGQLVSQGITWTTRTTPNNDWTDIAYGNGLFVAVGDTGTGDRVMTSPDGINWTSRTSAADNAWWGVTYGNGMFVAVAISGTGNRVMTSPDGINWTSRTSAADTNWLSVTYGNGLFVAVSGSSTDNVMTSPDGINWTSRTAPVAAWTDVTYGNGLFVAVSAFGVTADSVMTSPDGINWTSRDGASDNDWFSVTYGNGLFVAVASFTADSVMTSPDGINWTSRTVAVGNNWQSVTYGNGLFVAVADSGTSNRVMTSPDGINWTLRTSAADNAWWGVTYGNGMFVAVGWAGVNNHVMTSGKTFTNELAANNIYQGGTSFLGGLRAGTTSTSVAASIFLQSQAGINPFAIASSSGATLLTLTQAGNLGLGTTSPAGILSIDRRDITGAVVGGIDQFLTFTNNTASAVQFGNRSFLRTTNTATTTLVGSIIRIEDSTAFGNTVRGLEVQVDRGTNTRGENTALSGFARTFGVRGTTQGDAGGTFEPAGVYGETQGTTQGNAIRGYSSSITRASLLKLFQDTSVFTGTGLLMNFGNSGGSFSSTTASRFIDLQNAGTSRFTVGAYGMLTIGDGTTGQNAGIQIGNGGLCVDNDGACTASTTGRITSVSTAAGNSDLAEMYFSSEDLEAGEVVYLKGGLSVGRADSSDERADTVIGVVSTLPGLLLGYDDTSLVAGEEAYPIALAGRVPVKLSNENGPIRAGDALMLSSLPGIVMKASSTGTIVGVALEDFDDTRSYSETFINQFGESIIEPNFTPINREDDPRINDGCYFGGGVASGEAPCVPLKATTTDGQYDEADALVAAEAKAQAMAELEATPSVSVELAEGRAVAVGQIVMFVRLEERYVDEAGAAMLRALLATSTTENTDGEEETIWERIVQLANSFVDGVLSVLTLKADRVETSELCVDGVCLDADDVRRLLDQSTSVVGPEVAEDISVPDTAGGGSNENNEESVPPTEDGVSIEPSGDEIVIQPEPETEIEPETGDMPEIEPPETFPTEPVSESEVVAPTADQ